MDAISVAHDALFRCSTALPSDCIRRQRQHKAEALIIVSADRVAGLQPKSESLSTRMASQLGSV